MKKQKDLRSKSASSEARGDGAFLVKLFAKQKG